MGHCAGQSATSRRRRRPVVTVAVVGAAVLCAGAASVALGACGGSPRSALTPAVSPRAAGVVAPPVPPATGSPSPVPVVTAGPVPRGATEAAVRYWRLIDHHRYRALLTVVTPDSRAAAAVRAGRAGAFWGIDRVRVVALDATVGRTPPLGATLEFGMTIDVRPAGATAWRPGRNPVVMSLRRVDGSWLVCQMGSGP